MNVLLAVVLVVFARIGVMFQSAETVTVFINMAWLSLLLCFFNLIPIPPLDGSHVARNFIGMSWETYWNLCRYGFIFVIIVINVPGVMRFVGMVTSTVLFLIAGLFGSDFRDLTMQIIS
jgi:membrane-associated protease RseP (regulator of RpoE activity)